tara:strand:+ start:36 stop:872 length:837 start_codon:yes stop_codon:yes gene_type:complete
MISIVIPSILENSLVSTLESIDKSTIKPKEIIIILPDQHRYKNDNILKKIKKYKNTLIHYSKKKGQVNQRILGFKMASQKYVMQLDSDIILRKNTIEILFDFIKNHKDNISVSGFIYNNKDSTIKKDYINKYLNYLLFHGKTNPKPGTISQIGIPFSFGKNDFTDEFHKVEWLQGGIVMHKKSNLILENYFNFPGPAYCEDVIHSILLKRKNINLYLSKNAICTHIEVNSKKLRFDFYTEYIIRLKLLKLLGTKKYLRFNTWFLFYIIKINLNLLIRS